MRKLCGTILAAVALAAAYGAEPMRVALTFDDSLKDHLLIAAPMLEERGIYSPVVGVECRYRRPTHFDETIRITAKITEYTGVRLRISYEMINGQGVLVSTGSSEHCFTDTSGHPVILKNLHPDIDAVIRAAVEE